MKRIEPGCMALVIASFHSPRMVGSMVEVIEWVPAGARYTSRCGNKRLRATDFGAWHVQPSLGDSGTFHPAHLLRIDGDALPSIESITKEESTS